MPLPSDIYEEGRNYRIRLCMLVKDAIAVAEDSKVHVCDGCGEPIWVAEGQPLPPLPEGMELHGDLLICRFCSVALQAGAPTPGDKPTMLDQGAPEELVQEARDYFGLN